MSPWSDCPLVGFAGGTSSPPRATAARCSAEYVITWPSCTRTTAASEVTTADSTQRTTVTTSAQSIKSAGGAHSRTRPPQWESINPTTTASAKQRPENEAEEPSDRTGDAKDPCHAP